MGIDKISVFDIIILVRSSWNPIPMDTTENIFTQVEVFLFLFRCDKIQLAVDQGSEVSRLAP